MKFKYSACIIALLSSLSMFSHSSEVFDIEDEVVIEKFKSYDEGILNISSPAVSTIKAKISSVSHMSENGNDFLSFVLNAESLNEKHFYKSNFNLVAQLSEVDIDWARGDLRLKATGITLSSSGQDFLARESVDKVVINKLLKPYVTSAIDSIKIPLSENQIRLLRDSGKYNLKSYNGDMYLSL